MTTTDEHDFSDERRIAERLAEETGYPPEAFTEQIRELRAFRVPVSEIEFSLRSRYHLEKKPIFDTPGVEKPPTSREVSL